MLNNLKSDLYHFLHSNSAKASIAVLILLTISMISNMAVQSNTSFAEFSRETGTMADFLYFLPKSAVFDLIFFIFIAIFICEEYSCGFVKNIYPLHTKKSPLLAERYLLCIIFNIIFLAVGIISAFAVTVFNPIELGEINIFNMLLYYVTQILLLSAVSSFIMMFTHLGRSKTINILISIAYSFFLFYLLFSYIGYYIPSLDIMPYTIYFLSGNLPTVFSFEGYRTAFLVAISSTLLYNGISCFILHKKDI